MYYTYELGSVLLTILKDTARIFSIFPHFYTRHLFKQIDSIQYHASVSSLKKLTTQTLIVQKKLYEPLYEYVV